MRTLFPVAVVLFSAGLCFGGGPISIIYPPDFGLERHIYPSNNEMDWPTLSKMTEIPPVDPKKPLRFKLDCVSLFENGELSTLKAIMKMMPIPLNYEEFTQDQACIAASAPKCAAWSERQVLDLFFEWQNSKGVTVESPSQRLARLFEIQCAPLWIAWGALNEKHAPILLDAKIPMRDIVNWPNMKPGLLAILLRATKISVGLPTPGAFSTQGLYHVLKSPIFHNGADGLWLIFDAGITSFIIGDSASLVVPYSELLSAAADGVEDDLAKAQWFIRSEVFLLKLLSPTSEVPIERTIEVLHNIYSARSSGKFAAGISPALHSLLQSTKEEYADLKVVFEQMPNFHSISPISFDGFLKILEETSDDIQSSFISDLLHLFPGVHHCLDERQGNLLKGMAIRGLKDFLDHFRDHPNKTISDYLFPTEIFRIIGIFLASRSEHALPFLEGLLEFLKDRPVLKQSILTLISHNTDLIPAGFSLIRTPEELKEIGVIQHKELANISFTVRYIHDSQTGNNRYNYLEATLYELGLRPSKKGSFAASRIAVLSNKNCMLNTPDNHLHDAGGPRQAYLNEMVRYIDERGFFTPSPGGSQVKFHWMVHPEVGTFVGLFVAKSLQMASSLPFALHSDFFKLIGDPTDEAISRYYEENYQRWELASLRASSGLDWAKQMLDDAETNAANGIAADLSAIGGLLEDMILIKLEEIRRLTLTEETNFALTKEDMVLPAFAKLNLRGSNLRLPLDTTIPHPKLNPTPLGFAFVRRPENRLAVMRHKLDIVDRYFTELNAVRAADFHKLVLNFHAALGYAFNVAGIKYLNHSLGLFNLLLDSQDVDRELLIKKLKWNSDGGVSKRDATKVDSLVISHYLPIGRDGEVVNQLPVPYQITAKEAFLSFVHVLPPGLLRRLILVLTGNSMLRLTDIPFLTIRFEENLFRGISFYPIERVEEVSGDNVINWESWKKILVAMANYQRRNYLKMDDGEGFTDISQLYDLAHSPVAISSSTDGQGVEDAHIHGKEYFAAFQISTCFRSVSFAPDRRFIRSLAYFINHPTDRFEEHIGAN